MAGLPLSSMSSSSSLVVVLPAASDTTRVSHEPPVTATAPAAPPALVAPQHLRRAERSNASSPKSAPGSSRGGHPAGQLRASPLEALWKEVKLPAWPSFPRNARLSLLVKLPFAAGQGAGPRDRQPPAPGRRAVEGEGCRAAGWERGCSQRAPSRAS